MSLLRLTAGGGPLVLRQTAELFGLADRDSRFFFARFNIGMHYAALRDQARSLAAFRALLDHNPGRAAEIAEFFLHSPLTRACIDQQPGFAEALVQTCPELFRATPPAPMDAERPDEEDNP